MPLPGFPEKDINMILRIMASLLHFGNVAIAEKDGESCEVPVSLSCVPFVLSPTSIKKYCGQKYLLSRLSVSLYCKEDDLRNYVSLALYCSTSEPKWKS